MMTVNKQQTLQTGIYLLLHKHTISQSIRSLGKRRRGRGGGRRMRRRCEEMGRLRRKMGGFRKEEHQIVLK